MTKKFPVRSLGLDHPNVQKVIEIAEELTEANKILNIENLYSLAKRRLKIPRKGLLKIIQYLLNKKILVEGSKYTKETVLDNEYRRIIYNYIDQNPGTYFSQLKRDLLSGSSEAEASSGQLIWHLEMLLKFKYIKKLKVKNYSIFLPTDIADEFGILYFLLNDKINQKIITLLNNSGGIKMADVYKEINEQREHVYYRINNFIELGILDIIENGENLIDLTSHYRELTSQLFENNNSNKLMN
jgi:predicted transcriptional regulator